MLLKHLLDHDGTALREDDLFKRSLGRPNIEKRKSTLLIYRNVSGKLRFTCGLNMHVAAVKNLFQIVSQKVVLFLPLFFDNSFRSTTEGRLISERSGLEELP